MATRKLVRLGLWVYGTYYETKNPKYGHIEIAENIIKTKKWQGQFEVSKFSDPVDFLIFEKEAIKIGNRFGRKVVTIYRKNHGREVDEVLLDYEKDEWRIEYVDNPYLKR